jgi:hypothetical protein
MQTVMTAKMMVVMMTRVMKMIKVTRDDKVAKPTLNNWPSMCIIGMQYVASNNKKHCNIMKILEQEIALKHELTTEATFCC